MNACARLGKILQLILVTLRQVQLLVVLNLSLCRLVVVVAAVVDRPAKLQGLVEQIGLGECQCLVALVLADLELQGQSSRLCRTGCWWCS